MNLPMPVTFIAAGSVQVRHHRVVVRFIMATAPGKLTLCKICGHMTGMAVHLVAISV